MNQMMMQGDYDDEDEFFGDQSSGDECEVETTARLLSSNDSLNPQDGCELTNVNAIPTTSPSLSKYEVQSQQQRFHNLGYHEAYDEHKESQLQIGFENGYVQNFNHALRIGNLLGQCLFSENRNRKYNDDVDSHLLLGKGDTKEMFKEKSELRHAKKETKNNDRRAAAIVRKYLEEEQVKDGSTLDKTNENCDYVKHELQTIVDEKTTQRYL